MPLPSGQARKQAEANAPSTAGKYSWAMVENLLTTTFRFEDSQPEYNLKGRPALPRFAQGAGSSVILQIFNNFLALWIYKKHSLRIFASIVTLMLISLFLYIEVLDNEEKIAEAADRRYRSYLLADELRQSSDDLTRMARTYTVSGNPKFKEYFDRILAIRGGEAPRPVDYHNIYWDFVSATGVPPRVDTPPQVIEKADEGSRVHGN